MKDEYTGLIGLGKAIISKTRLSNAMGVPLIFVVVIFLGGLGGYLATRADSFFWIMFTPVIFFIFAYIFIMIFKPNLLRTEEHEERMLQISSGMGQKGDEIPQNEVLEMKASSFGDAQRSKEIKESAK